MPGARVEARALSRRFAERTALGALDLTIEPGEAFGLLGANGAGKTTFIRLVTGFLAPSSGSLTVDGVSPADHPRDVQQRLGFVSEVSHLYPDLGVERYLRFAAGIRGLSGERQRQAVANAVETFHLETVRKRRIGNLSKGFAQRVSLAQALIHDPALVIADEPTSGLDPLQRRDVQTALAAEAGNRTLLLCTHDLDEARSLTTRCAVLSEGELVVSGPTEEVLAGETNLALFRGTAPPHEAEVPA
ncbi:MAG: ABC transporter ATP-binding protein [Myxococcota bacterium]|nr:ABC transporter ATP-binding protein [Myxococcota bacterium]